MHHLSWSHLKIVVGERVEKPKNRNDYNSASVCHRFRIRTSKYMFVRAKNLNKLVTNTGFKIQDGYQSGSIIPAARWCVSHFLKLFLHNCTAINMLRQTVSNPCVGLNHNNTVGIKIVGLHGPIRSIFKITAVGNGKNVIQIGISISASHDHGFTNHAICTVYTAHTVICFCRTAQPTSSLQFIKLLDLHRT